MILKKEGLGVFLLYPKDLDLFIVDTTNDEICLEIFGICRWIPKYVDTLLYVHQLNGDITISRTKNFEFGLIQERKLTAVYEEERWITPKERDNMFSNYKITDVKFGEISDVALETAVEKIAHELQGVEIKTKGEKTYMVKNGKAIELKGEEFIALVQKYVVGKTVSGLRRNKEMFTLIQNLGIISEVTLQCQADDLSTIFG